MNKALVTAERVSRKPSLFLSLTGVSLTLFRKLVQQFNETNNTYARKYLSRPNYRQTLGRKRAVGGGRKYCHSIDDRLLMFLIHRRLCATYTLLGCLFNLNRSNVSRSIKHFNRLAGQSALLPAKTTRSIPKIRTVVQLLCKYPSLKKNIIDAPIRSWHQATARVVPIACKGY